MGGNLHRGFESLPLRWKYADVCAGPRYAPVSVAAAIALFGRAPVLRPRLGPLLAGPAGVAELIVEVCQLVAEVPDAIVQVGRLMLGLHGTLSSLSRVARRASGSRLRLGAQLLQNPDSLDESLTLRRIHV
jgi:hypothetical protein